jgi:putative zinc finger/helix-turn-helix YgiT family protein
MKTCYDCDAQDSLTQTVETRPYLEDSGLCLEVQQTIYTCSNCGAEHVGLTNLEGLHDEIVAAILSNPSRLRGPEIRFLRKHLGWSGDDFAKYFKVSPSTVSRWENDKQDLSKQGDLLLRMCISQLDPIANYHLHDAPDLETSTVMPVRVFTSTRGRWTRA